MVFSQDVMIGNKRVHKERHVQTCMFHICEQLHMWDREIILGYALFRATKWMQIRFAPFEVQRALSSLARWGIVPLL